MYRLIPDPLADAPPGLQIILQTGFVLFGVLCGWIAFDTRRALKKLVSLTPAPAWLKIDPTRKGWIWFYRIEAAVGFIGVILSLVAHWFARS